MCLLQHLRANLSLFLITITLLTMISSVFGQSIYNYHSCSGLSYNDTANIKTLLDSLSSKAAHNNTFYNDTSINLHGLYLCRGDVATDMCQKCVEAASQEIQQPSRCQSNDGAVIWYDECMLHYSVVNFFGKAELDPQVWMWNAENTTSPNDPNVQALKVMYNLVAEVRTEPMMYAHGGGTQDGYGMVQCSRDISGQACSANCLGNLMAVAEKCCQGQKGWRILAPSCNLRYENYAFLTQPVPPPAPSPMPPTAPSPMPPTALTTTIKGNVGENTTKIQSVKNGNTTKVVLITVPVSTLLVVTCGFYFYRLFGRRSEAREVLQGMSQEILLNNLESQTRKRFMVKGLQVQDEDDSRDMHYFDLTTLQIATNNFSDANKLGQGGFGPVYKGKLHDGKEIAVKRLSINSGQGLEEFRTEVKLIVKLQHKNLVRLLGCCFEKDEKLLVYEYMANTSLDAFLFDATKRGHLDWTKRFNIIQGITRGLLYLHRDSRLKIIHRDLKVSNILLDKDMNAKISDFGLARTFRGTQQLANTHRPAGTIGYMSPEYALRGIFSEKSDVFSFGVLLLEIICGRKNTSFHDEQYTSLLGYVWHLWNEGRALDFMDQALVDSCYLPEVIMRCIHIALLCVQDNAADRPTMSSIARMLTSEIDGPQPKQPTFTLGSDLQSQNKNTCSVNEVTESMLEGR